MWQDMWQITILWQMTSHNSSKTNISSAIRWKIYKFSIKEILFSPNFWDHHHQCGVHYSDKVWQKDLCNIVWTRVTCGVITRMKNDFVMGCSKPSQVPDRNWIFKKSIWIWFYISFGIIQEFIICVINPLGLIWLNWKWCGMAIEMLCCAEDWRAILCQVDTVDTVNGNLLLQTRHQGQKITFRTFDTACSN